MTQSDDVSASLRGHGRRSGLIAAAVTASLLGPLTVLLLPTPASAVVGAVQPSVVLTDTPPQFNGLFGYSVAGYGSTIAVGAAGTRAVYVYDVVAGQPTNRQTMIPSGSVDGDRTGSVVALTDKYLAISAPVRSNGNSSCINGALDLFQRSASGFWVEATTLYPPSASYPCGAAPGRIEIVGDTLVVGTGQYGIDTYDLSGPSPQLVNLFYYTVPPRASVPAGVYERAWDLSADGSVLAVAGSNHCVYLYDRQGLSWSQRPGCVPKPTDLEPFDGNVVVSNDWLVVPGVISSSRGALVVYRMTASGPMFERRLVAPEDSTFNGNGFGIDAVVIRDNEVFVSSIESSNGRLYRFDLGTGDLLDRFNSDGVYFTDNSLAGGGIALAGGAMFAGAPVSVATPHSHWEGQVVGWSAAPIADTTTPSVTGAVSPTPNTEQWNNGSVTVTWAVDDPSASVPPPVTISTEGANQLVTSAPSCDPFGNCATGSVLVSIDRTNPTAVATPSPVANAANWNNTPVEVSWSCNDALSGVVSCPGPTLLGEGAGQDVPELITDHAGNTISATYSQVNIDLTPPTLSGLVVTSPSGPQWFNTDVQIDWTCSDALSGIDDACPASSVITGEGISLNTLATISDVAGNVRQTQSPTVRIDRTSPVTVSDVTSEWSSSDVEVHLTASDNLSGVAETRYVVDGQPEAAGTMVTVGGVGVHTLTWWSVDHAGNVEDQSTISVRIDQNAPTISSDQSPPPNGAGWNRTQVTVTFTCGSTLSGIRSCTPPVTVATEGAGQSVLGTAVSQAGVSATSTATVNIDFTYPTIVASASRPADSNGWYNAPVNIRFTCDDALSGVTACSNDLTISSNGENQSRSGTAVDAASNSSSTTLHGINIDQLAPIITATVSPAPLANGWHNGPVTVHFQCADSLSGVAFCPPDVIVATPGFAQTVPGTTIDVAGNEASITVDGINIDTAAPTVLVTGVTNGAVYSIGSVPLAGCSTVDGLSGVATPASLTVTPNGSTVTVKCGGAVDKVGNSSPTVTVTYTLNDLTVAGLQTLTGQYVLGSTAPNRSGVNQKLSNDLKTGKVCKYITDIQAEVGSTLSQSQANTLIYWARQLDPSCP